MARILSIGDVVIIIGSEEEFIVLHVENDNNIIVESIDYLINKKISKLHKIRRIDIIKIN